jgi:perosamine synthetase
MFRTLPPSGVPIRLTDILSGLFAMFSGNKVVSHFNQEVCRKFGVRHAITVSSGRAGLSLLFQALQKLHPDRNEVLIPAFTSFSVPSAVVNAGLKISLYDIEPTTLSPSCLSLTEAITDKTLCIVVCHLFGYPADIDAVLKMADERQIPLIDDAAQAMGARYKGKMVGTFGAAGLFSLSRGKNISALDGGIIITDDDVLAKNLRTIALYRPSLKDRLMLLLKAMALSFLLHPRCYWLPKSIPPLNIGASVFDPHFMLQTFTAFQAGIARRMLARLDGITAERQKIAGRYIHMFSGNNKVELPQTVVGGEAVFLRFPVMSLNAQETPEFGIVKSYPAAIGNIPDIEPFVVSKQEFPGANILAGRIITLPTHLYVTDEDCIKAVELIS